ncbi:hypothetical protein [Methylobacterium sp. J-072]|uniref:hypothetical protein n=1 Tax=Methylobacterium sp. J-072 TaxID=2836651 RepID=UPI0028BF1995|nr:hypothetical protein [Methylobacterium sp. J-072]
MKIGAKLLGFVAACSLTTLVVAGVSVATLQRFEQALTRVEDASVRSLDAANFNRLAAEVTMDSRGVYASADRTEPGNTPPASARVSPQWMPSGPTGRPG